MIKTDYAKEIKKLLIDAGLTYEQLGSHLKSARRGEGAGGPVSRMGISKRLSSFDGTQLTPVQVELLEALGYDIELKFVKRK